MSDNINLSTSLVDLDNITPKVDLSYFSADEIENMANLIMTTGGVVRPIILKRTGIESCEIVTGDFEYYATVKASEIYPEHSGMIRGFIIKEKQEENIRKQQEILRGLDAPIAESPEIPIDVQDSQVDLTKMFNNLTLSLTKELNSQLDKKLQPMTIKLNELVTKPTTVASLNFQPENNTTIQKHLEVLFTKVDQLSNKVEEIQKQISSNVQPPSGTFPTQKLNLQEATKTEIEDKFSDLRVNTNQITAAWKAIQKWKTSNEGLTWRNLKKSATNKEFKVDNFGEKTYNKLKEIGYIP
ncbi:MAG: hypothetical protein AAGJ08_12410 [Cyanobacteria bacterium P01_H01_bin.35]